MRKLAVIWDLLAAIKVVRNEQHGARIGGLSRGPLRCAAELGEGQTLRFMLVSVLRGQCPWLSVRSGGRKPVGTDR